jgi:cobaltochelatase CobS
MPGSKGLLLQQQAGAGELCGRYVRRVAGRSEWWRVTPSEREQLFRIEHGHDAHGDSAGGVDLETVVDRENLAAKLRKWSRDGFVRDADAADAADAATHGDPASDPAFMTELARLYAQAQAAHHAAPAPDPATHVTIGDATLPLGAGGPLTPQLNPAYLFAPRCHDIIADIAENRRIMLIGHTGCGKTSLIEQVAARARQPVIRANMNGQTTIGDFVGFWSVKGGETVWVDGVLPVAMRSGAWLIIDEIDFAEPAILAVLTAVLETDGQLMLKEKGNEIVAPHPAFRLFATANAVGAMSQFRHLYQGANLMNEAFLDRWRVYLIDYLTPEQEAQVLVQTLAPALTLPLARTLAAIAADCRAAFAREDLASAFSTRRLLDWAALMVRVGDPERAAEPTLYAKVSAADAALIRHVIRQHIAPAS